MGNIFIDCRVRVDAAKGCVGREGGLCDTDRHSVLHNSAVYMFDSVNMDQMCVFYSELVLKGPFHLIFSDKVLSA